MHTQKLSVWCVTDIHGVLVDMVDRFHHRAMATRMAMSIAWQYRIPSCTTSISWFPAELCPHILKELFSCEAQPEPARQTQSRKEKSELLDAGVIQSTKARPDSLKCL